jgi:hypothetical protein
VNKKQQKNFDFFDAPPALAHEIHKVFLLLLFTKNRTFPYFFTTSGTLSAGGVFRLR